jgi:hypothetical protein
MAVIGGDFGSLSTNPAGIGMYKWSEFQLSPGVFNGPTASSLDNGENNSTDDQRTAFMVPSLSYVKVAAIGNQYYPVMSGDSVAYINTRYSRWTRVSFAVGLNRSANFNRKFEFVGEQDRSITQFFIERGEGINPNNLGQYYTGPAYDAYVTTYDTYRGEYLADIDADASVMKSQQIVRRGGIDDIVLAVGADYDNKLQIGASLTFPILHFNEKKKYSETLPGHPVFNRLELDENLKATGSGVSIKLGAKYIVARKIHLGVAIHSPTWMRISEEFDTRVFYNYVFDADLFPEPGPQEALSPLGAFEYDFRSPWRAIGGIGVIVGKIGFISTELEFVDYKSAKFTIIDDELFADELNMEIDNNLGSALMVRVGGEFRIKKFRLRGGVGLNQNIYKSNSDFGDPALSLGAGYWFGNQVFLDVAYRHQPVQQVYNPYSLTRSVSPVVNSDINENNFVLTFGVRM